MSQYQNGRYQVVFQAITYLIELVPRWFYFDIAWYAIMIVMDILVIVGANGEVRTM